MSITSKFPYPTNEQTGGTWGGSPYPASWSADIRIPRPAQLEWLDPANPKVCLMCCYILFLELLSALVSGSGTVSFFGLVEIL
jgi:hypothetical protein